MGPIGSVGDVPPPWGGWGASQLALVRCGGPPAVVWARRCCWAEGRLWPRWRRCGVRGVPARHCSGQPTDPQQAQQRPPVALGWCGAMFCGCGCSNVR